MLLKNLFEIAVTPLKGISMLFPEWLAHPTTLPYAAKRRLSAVAGVGWVDQVNTAGAIVNRRIDMAREIPAFNTIDATPIVMYTSPDLVTALTAYRAYRVSIEVWACRSDTADDSWAYYQRECLFTTNGAALTKQASSNTVEQESAAGLDCTVAVDGTGFRFTITVTGKAATNLKWYGFVKIIDNEGKIY